MSQLRCLNSTSSTLHAQILPSSQGAWSSLNASWKNTASPSRPNNSHCPPCTSKSWVRWHQLRKAWSMLTISCLRLKLPQRTSSSPIASRYVRFWPLRCKTSPPTVWTKSVKTEEWAVKCTNKKCWERLSSARWKVSFYVCTLQTVLATVQRACLTLEFLPTTGEDHFAWYFVILTKTTSDRNGWPPVCFEHALCVAVPLKLKKNKTKSDIFYSS